MMKFEVLSMKAENFMGLKPIDLKFGHKNILNGVNGIGKTRIMNLFYWIVKNTMADGREADNIRPRDTEGNIIPKATITAEMQVKINDVEYLIKKTLREKYTREGEYTGTETKIEIDGFPYTLKKYNEWWEQKINKNTFDFCSNPAFFFSMTAAKKREVLTTMFKFDEQEFLTENPNFNKALDIMKGHSVEETLKTLSSNLKTKSKERDELPIRIAEIEGSLTSKAFNYDEEIEKLNVSLKEKEEKLREFEIQNKEIESAGNSYHKAVSALNEYTAKVEKGYREKVKSVDDSIFSLERRIKEIDSNIFSAENDIQSKEKFIKDTKIEKDNLVNIWQSTKKMTFDESATICAYCGQKLPEDKISSMSEEFEKNKKERIAEITAQGRNAKEQIEKAKGLLEHQKLRIEELQTERTSIEKQIEKNKKMLEEIMKPDLKNDVEYLKLVDEVNKLASRNEKYNSVISLINLINKEKSSTISQITELKTKKEFEENTIQEKTNRIEELRQLQLKHTKSISSIKSMIDLIEGYAKAKNEFLRNKINSNFEGISFRFERPLQNGTLEPCCVLEIGGIAYEQTLNTGHRKTAEIALVRAFQKANNINMPIWVDEYSVIDPERIPATEQQMFLLGRTDDKELVLKVED